MSQPDNERRSDRLKKVGTSRSNSSNDDKNSESLQISIEYNEMPCFKRGK